MRIVAELCLVGLGCQFIVTGCQTGATAGPRAAEARSLPLVAAVRAGDDISDANSKVGRTAMWRKVQAGARCVRT